MKIFYTVTITGNQHESRDRVADASPMCCCDEMYNAWGEDIDFDPERKVVDLMSSEDYGGASAFASGAGLRFCPWCSQPIELECAGTEDRRVTACAAELKGVSRYLEAEGRKAFCRNQPLPGSAYCGRHKHLEEGADTGELFGIPVVYDELQPPGEVSTYPVERTCKCAPATLTHIVVAPVPGVQCRCGAVWPIRWEKPLDAPRQGIHEGGEGEEQPVATGRNPEMGAPAEPAADERHGSGAPEHQQDDK